MQHVLGRAMQPLNMPKFETDVHKLVGTTKTLELANVSIGYGVLGKHYLHISCTLSGTVIVSNILLRLQLCYSKTKLIEKQSNFNCNVENAVRFLINNRLLSIFTKLQRASLKKNILCAFFFIRYGKTIKSFIYKQRSKSFFSSLKGKLSALWKSCELK